MVGVPTFSKWVGGPSARTVCPIWWADRRRIIPGPATRQMARAVSTLQMPRKVR